MEWGADSALPPGEPWEGDDVKLKHETQHWNRSLNQQSAFCYGRKHIIQAFGLLRFSKVASKTLLIFAVGETAGISQGCLSPPRQGWPAPWNASWRYLWQPPWPRLLSFSSIGCQLSFFLLLSKEKIPPFARWNVFTELREFGGKFWLWLCLMLLWPSAVSLRWVLGCSFYSSCHSLLSSEAFCWLIWEYKHVFRCKDLKNISVLPNVWTLPRFFLGSLWTWFL